MEKFLQTFSSERINTSQWYSPETGIYHSKHPSVNLPANDSLLDVDSFIFSHKHNGRTALVDSLSGYSISYPQLFPLVQSVASGLRHHFGISQGDAVLLLLPNSIYFPVIFLALLYLGAIVIPMNPLLSVSEIKKQVTLCKTKISLAFTIYENVDKLRSWGTTPVVAVPENLVNDFKEGRFSDFHKLIAGKFDLVERPVIRQQDTAAILYSSGTTGASKGAELTHGNFIAAVELFVRFEASQYEYLSSEAVFLAVLPMFHIYGLSLFALGLLSLGPSVVVMRRFEASEMLKVIDKYGVTHFPVVPPILMALTKAAKGLCGNSLKSLKQVSSGAAPANNKIIEDFVGAFPHVDFIQGYGMTESTAVGTRGFNTKKFSKYFSVGLLAPNIQAKVVDWVNGCFLPPGSTGELWLRGPGTMKGYINNADATMSTIDKEGWLHTGDIAYFDEDGYLYIVDRLKEISPADLETVLICHPEILDVAVTGAMDKVLGEIPVAFVVRRDGSTLTEAAVIDYLAQRVSFD
ncbi:4-coumarate--CoA ligase-like 6 [Citrus sinensis]|nr:4-coumarate--CoA ligase-like 6 [Citrus sinensis]